MHRLSPAVAVRDHSLVPQLLLLRSTGSTVVARGLSCSAACGILVSRPGIEPSSPALEGGLSTTGLPGKSPRLEQDQLFPSVQSWPWFPLQRAKQDTHSQTLLYKPEQPPRNEQTHNPDTHGHLCTNIHTWRSPQMCAST